MMASRRIVRAVAAVFVGSVLLLGTVDKGVDAVTVCNAEEEKAVTLAPTQNKLEIKCGDDFPTLFPGDVTKVYEQAEEHATPVDLKKAVHKAVLTKESGQTQYTLTLDHSTVVKNNKILYYFCKKEAPEKYCRIKITVEKREATPATKCDSKTLNKIFLDKQETSIKFACSDNYQTLLPSVTAAFGAKGKREIPLDTLYAGATLEPSQQHVYTLKIPERRSSKLLYYRCKKDEDNVCDIEITAEKNIDDSESAPTPVTCTGSAQVEVTLSAEYPGVPFACGLDVPILDPADMNTVYDTDDMDHAVPLSDVFNKAALYTDSTVAAHTYFLYIPYRKEKKLIYYKCKDNGSTSCKVKVTVEPNHDVVPVCHDATKGAYLSYEDFSENVKFKCDAAFPDVVPSDLTKVFNQDPSSPAAQPVALTTVYSGAKLVSDGDTKSPTFTLTIPPHLPRETKTLYYQCKKAENEHCTVRIRVAAKKPEMITCAEGTEEKVTITGPGEIVRFKCGASMALSPSNDKEVFDNRDNKCSNVADLASLVPNASIATDNDDPEGKVLTFNGLPRSGKALCYSCTNEAGPAGFSASFRAPQNSKQCRLLIDVQSAAQGLNAHTLAGHAFILMSVASVIFSAL